MGKAIYKLSVRALIAATFPALLFFGTRTASATLVDLGPGSFTPAAAEITFDEFPAGTVNPTITFAAGTLGNVTVSFAGSFLGQTVTGTTVRTLGTVTPSVPLALDTSDNASTVQDPVPGATPPTLSGTPIYNGPIAVLFSTPVAGVGLKGGYFDTLNATSITAFDSAGNTLGSITNSQTGYQFYGLADSTGQNVIKGISFYITGNEPAGFEIDDLTFGAADVVPEPITGTMLLGGLLIAAGRRPRRS